MGIVMVGLKASNGKFVCADGGGGGAVVADRDAIGGWETFRLIDLGNGNCALQTLVVPRYVCAEGGGGGLVVANRVIQAEWETFKRHNVGSNKVALQANNGMYLCTEEEQGGVIVANRPGIGAWETFELVTVAQDGVMQPGTDDVRIEAKPWGLVLTLSHAATNALATGTISLSGIALLVAAIPAAAAVAGIVSGALAGVAGIVKGVDQGKGVYLTMLWITPGLLVPTPR